jgi:predicted transcriptional regulator
MPRPKSTRPTDFELEILSVLWDDEIATVRDVHEKILPSRPNLGRTTVSKIMDVMVAKGMIEIASEERPARYQASIDRKQTQKSLVRDLISRVFQGSPAKLIMHAVSGKKASRDELDEIRKLIDSMEKK